MIKTRKGMQIGTVFPQAEIGPGRGAIKAIVHPGRRIGRERRRVLRDRAP